MFKDTEIIAAFIAGITVLLAEVIKIFYSYHKDKKSTKRRTYIFH